MDIFNACSESDDEKVLILCLEPEWERAIDALDGRLPLVIGCFYLKKRRSGAMLKLMHCSKNLRMLTGSYLGNGFHGLMPRLIPCIRPFHIPCFWTVDSVFLSVSVSCI
jgi:hypothetical protein